MTAPDLATLTPRDYREPHFDLAANIRAFLDQSPDAFYCLLYRADPDQPETVTPEIDVVGCLESTERTLTYQAPVLCRGVIIPDSHPRESTSRGDLAAPAHDPVVMILSEAHIPHQSVIQYREYGGVDEVREVTLYVRNSRWIGTAPGVWTKQYCLPAQSFEGLKRP